MTISKVIEKLIQGSSWLKIKLVIQITNRDRCIVDMVRGKEPHKLVGYLYHEWRRRLIYLFYLENKKPVF